MHTLEVIVLIFSTASGAIAVGAALRCLRLADDCDDALTKGLREAGKLNAMAGRLIALEGAVESLAAQHRRLAGKFHADKAERAETALTDPMALGTHPQAIAAACENYLTAQREGPRSEAASCECDYCVSRRADRDALRRQLPKGPHAARVRAIEAASRGQE